MDNTEKMPELKQDTSSTEIIEQPGCCTRVSAKLNDQDFTQKMNVYVSFIFELYRVVMGSFLILFVPQKCGEELCTMFEPVNAGNQLTDAAFGVNIATFCMFLCMYYAEITRENKMITYLHVNIEEPCDDEAVGEALLKLPAEKKQDILVWDKRYLRTGQVALFGFVANVALSTVVIYDNFLDSKTTSALITNILFMALKINETYSITNTSENIFYSAYLNERVQFNDADPDKIVEIEDSNESTKLVKPEESAVENNV
jgi:hypothetical protein